MTKHFDFQRFSSSYEWTHVWVEAFAFRPAAQLLLKLLHLLTLIFYSFFTSGAELVALCDIVSTVVCCLHS